MAWDSTGQEGVYAWSKYFNDTTTVVNVINSILAYQPTVPHWGYNGNARRYWYVSRCGCVIYTAHLIHTRRDNVYAGKLQRIERQIHHYGSGLNALPLVSEYMSSPNDFYLLRVGYGGASGPMTNIDEEGFASASFHSFEDTLKWDAYSGDYGPNFVGHSLGTGTFIIDHPEFGWQAFGGTILSTSPSIRVQPKDSLRRRVFIAPIAALLMVDAGAFSLIEYDPSTHKVTLTVSATAEGSIGAAAALQGRLVVTQTVALPGTHVLQPTGTFTTDAGAWVLPFKGDIATIVLE